MYVYVCMCVCEEEKEGEGEKGRERCAQKSGGREESERQNIFANFPRLRDCHIHYRHQHHRRR